MPAHHPCQRRRGAADDRRRDAGGGAHPDDGHRASIGSRHQLHLARLALEAEATQQPPVQAAGLGVEPPRSRRQARSHRHRREPVGARVTEMATVLLLYRRDQGRGRQVTLAARAYNRGRGAGGRAATTLRLHGGAERHPAPRPGRGQEPAMNSSRALRASSSRIWRGGDFHEVGGRLVERAADAPIEAQAGAADGVDDHAGGVGAVPHLQLQLHDSTGHRRTSSPRCGCGTTCGPPARARGRRGRRAHPSRPVRSRVGW